MTRGAAESLVLAFPGSPNRTQAQRLRRDRFVCRAALLSLGDIVSATSNTLVLLRYSSCFECCATHRQPGGHGPSSAQCPKPKEQWHSITGSSKATHRGCFGAALHTGKKKRPPQAVKGVLPIEAEGDPAYDKPSLGLPLGDFCHLRWWVFLMGGAGRLPKSPLWVGQEFVRPLLGVRCVGGAISRKSH